MRFDTLIFDFDGTIAQSGLGITRCVADALARLDKPVPDDATLRKFIGPPLLAGFVEYTGLTAEEAATAVQYYQDRYRTVGMFEADIYAGIAPMLKALKDAGVYVAVASGKPTVFLKQIIEHFGLTGYFDAVCGIEVENDSSDKKAQILAALPEDADLSRTCMVGDRSFDVAAGRTLGLHTVGTAYGYGSREELEAAGADFVADDVASLCEYLLDGAPLPKGKMISFEGSDGCGKSTHMRKLGAWLTSRGYEVVTTREPGGCPISEKIREVLLSLDSKGMAAECEALLYAAARIELVREVILPALKSGKIVLCDRFLDSSIAYQAYGRELGEDFIRQINRAASDAVMPDLTLMFEVSRETAKARMAQGAPLDRLEIEKEDFFTRVAQGFARVAREEPQRVRRIDSGREMEEVFADVLAQVDELMTTRG